MKGLSTQTAILLAGAFVAIGLGVGLTFGLRGRSAPLESNARESNPQSDVPQASTLSPGAPPSPANAKGGLARGNAEQGSGEQGNAEQSALLPSSAQGADARTRTVGADASRALAPQLPVLRTRCWEPARAKSAEPKRVTLVLNYTFGADGKQLARGVSDVPGASRPDVTRCVAATVSTIEVPPPGERTYVEVPITLP